MNRGGWRSRIAHAYEELGSLYNRHLNALETRFPALYGQICLPDQNVPYDVGPVYNIPSRRSDFRELFDIYESEVVMNQQLGEKLSGATSDQNDILYELNDILHQMRREDLKQHRKQMRKDAKNKLKKQSYQPIKESQDPSHNPNTDIPILH
ncbi:MAG: hypothetical protein EZS28_013924 [Streblomastix strix]|uniref:Uncharacterized protein n=1 Tax=Streblomastix strix TaxID=222440 RepID=A0A5J4W6Z1_9EUKA|nr:MAG: hypothetical protein EZS28_013924 [Streblomastix strix]